MPSTVVHVAFGAVVATALLREFDAKALAAVCAFAALPDLDTFLGLWIHGGHRALLHTALLPVALGALVLWDSHREASWLRGRFGARGPHVAGVGVVALALGGIGPDLLTNGVNVLYPVHDQFYALSGKLELSSTKGSSRRSSTWERTATPPAAARRRSTIGLAWTSSAARTRRTPSASSPSSPRASSCSSWWSRRRASSAGSARRTANVPGANAEHGQAVRGRGQESLWELKRGFETGLGEEREARRRPRRTKRNSTRTTASGGSTGSGAASTSRSAACRSLPRPRATVSPATSSSCRSRWRSSGTPPC